MEHLTVTTYYEKDHDRLDELFKNFRQYKRIDFDKAKEFFKQFKLGLQRHIIWEEEILFPVFELKTGTTEAGPTQVMRMEHRMIGTYLEQIHDQVRLHNPDTDEEEEKLLEVLSAHNQKEERILYPAIDNSLNGDELTSVFTTMENLPEDRYNTCCRQSRQVNKKS